MRMLKMFVTVSPNSENIDELMKYLLYELKIRNMPITKFRMLKLIFKIKKELGEDCELYSELPYYWYYYGPYSGEVVDSVNFIKPKCDQRGNSIILKDSYLNEFENNKLIPNYPEIKTITQNILNDRDAFYTTLEKEVYKEYAPFDIMYPFKFDVYDIADKMRSTHSFNTDLYVKTLFKCEAKLPCDKYYNEYSDLFSKFLTNIDFINEENNIENYWKALRFPIQELWKTFTKGVRVQYKDDAYKSDESLWDLKFKNSLNELSITINKTNEYIHNDFKDTYYTPSQKRMINTTIGSYLRG